MLFFLTALALGGEVEVRKEFLYEQAPFPSCHASTVVALGPDELLAAYFAGKDEGAPDVAIWLSRGKRQSDGAWTWDPPELAHREPNVPCWNPVLFLAKKPDGGEELLLFLKAGPSPERWSGFLKRSADRGKTWTAAELLPAGILGPVRSKPIQMPDGRLICGSSVESYKAWGCWVEITPDLGKTWSKHGPINVPGHPRGIIQASVFSLGGDKLAFLARAGRQIGTLVRSESNDGGLTWTQAVKTPLPNPDAGADCTMLADGRLCVIYNDSPRFRLPLRLALSSDGGKTFTPSVILESEPPGEYSYPALVQASDGTLHATYTWRRQKIRHATIPLAALVK
ncbi:MAG TPA: sialidase family protein [Planctomycetia bacterium]|nr:sialidase family protein [Planctomycetia bacterium]